MRMNSDEQARKVENAIYGSIGNRIREIYNLAYKRGYEDGMKELASKIAADVLESEEEQ